MNQLRMMLCIKESLSNFDDDDSYLQIVALKGIDFLMNYVLGVFFLYPPNLYYYHHIYNHHKENCGPKDVTSPIFYNRQSVSHFCRAALKFMLGWFTAADLLLYLIKNKHYIAAINVFFGQVYFYAAIYLIGLVSPLFAISFLDYSCCRWIFASKNNLALACIYRSNSKRVYL